MKTFHEVFADVHPGDRYKILSKDYEYQKIFIISPFDGYRYIIIVWTRTKPYFENGTFENKVWELTAFIVKKYDEYPEPINTVEKR